MPPVQDLIGFSLVCLAMVCTPGPNMIYLISRTVGQGRRAGFISLCGVRVGFLIYMSTAVLGITALLMAVPFAYDALRYAGAIYLLYLAWQSLMTDKRSAFSLEPMRPGARPLLFFMGFMTSVLNPKVAVLYLSLLPQFIRPESGDALQQGLIFGSTQIAISLTVNALIILFAGSLAKSLAANPRVRTVQRWITGTVFGALALRMATETRR